MGLKHGEGFWKGKNEYYKGNWKKGKPDGFGIYKWANKGEYSG